MNLGRLALAAVAATVVDAVYGFVVYGMLLAGQFARFPGVYRSDEAGMAHLPLMFLGIFVAIAALTLIYSKGYEGGSGVVEGVRFGVLVAIVIVFVFVSVNYATLNIGRKLSLELAVAAFVEWVLVCVTIGVVYKPLGAAGRQAPAV
ncbi:MAG TPA: hypothetical protein VF219_18665 [Vicinamibacterales bacterium]